MVISYNNADSTYTVAFPYYGQIVTTVTASCDVAISWINDTLRINEHNLNDLLVGFGIKYFSLGSTVGPTALLLLCVDRRCLVFQLLHCLYIPDRLSMFLSDDRIRLVGVGIGSDVRKLHMDHGLVVGCRMNDLRQLARDRAGLRYTRWLPLSGLVREVLLSLEMINILELDIVRFSNWDELVLPPWKIEYATVVAFASYRIGRRLLT